MARPSTYTKAIANKICKQMAEGKSLRAICANSLMPAISTVMLWVANDREGFSEQYAKAFEARMLFHADELLEIADNGENDYMESNHPSDDGYRVNGEAIARSRLRVDTRKWLMSKLLSRYADKQEVNIDSSDLVAAMSAMADKLPS